MSKKEMWNKIAELRNQRKTLMTEGKEIRAKVKTETDKEQKKLMREKVKANDSQRRELLVQIKELYKQKAAMNAATPDPVAPTTPETNA